MLTHPAVEGPDAIEAGVDPAADGVVLRLSNSHEEVAKRKEEVAKQRGKVAERREEDAGRRMDAQAGEDAAQR